MIEEITIVDQQQRQALIYYITREGDKFHVWDIDETPVIGVVRNFIVRKYLEAQTLIFII
jgi:hypothetical protein